MFNRHPERFRGPPVARPRHPDHRIHEEKRHDPQAPSDHRPEARRRARRARRRHARSTPRTSRPPAPPRRGRAPTTDEVIVVTARRRAESLQRRADRGHRLFGRGARDAGRDRHHRHRRHHAQRHARDVARHQHDADRLHPRRRPAGSGRRLRGGRRPLSRRRLSQPSAGRGARHLRRRADRGAARAAGHALRPQHDRRRDQICHPPARPTIPTLSVRANLGTDEQADLVVIGEHAGRATSVRVGASVARLSARRLRREPHHRPRQLQSRTSGPRAAIGRARTTSATSSSASQGDYTQRQ